MNVQTLNGVVRRISAKCKRKRNHLNNLSYEEFYKEVFKDISFEEAQEMLNYYQDGWFSKDKILSNEYFLFQSFGVELENRWRMLGPRKEMFREQYEAIFKIVATGKLDIKSLQGDDEIIKKAQRIWRDLLKKAMIRSEHVQKMYNGCKQRLLEGA